jgi:hypothetical protein
MDSEVDLDEDVYIFIFSFFKYFFKNIKIDKKNIVNCSIS